jgi:transposase-like protein
MIINSKHPAYVLMPSDLFHYTSQNLDGTYDATITSAITKASKYVLLGANLTWVCFGIPEAPRHVVYTNEHLVDYMPPHIPESHAATVGTLVDWAAEQLASLEKDKGSMIESRIGTADSGLKTYTPGLSPRIYVPEQRRRPLYEFTHNAINHMAALKTFNELSKSYYWPTMKRDVRKWYAECSSCELLKAKRNITHSQYRGVSGEAPRKRWAIDFHGVGAEDAKANVLGAIDMDSLHVELAVMKHRTAENVERFIRDRVLFRQGTPASIHSDHARELIGRVMTRLANTFGYVNTSTGGYCPMGNSIIESFWQYFNICLRNLSDEDYENVEDHLQHIAWAWNTTVHATTGARPFEIMTGTSPVTLTDALILPAPTNDVLNMSNIREAAVAYTTAARNHGDYMRILRAEVLNRHGRKLAALKVGDYVKILQPPSHSEAVRRRRKAKHICQWRGPLKITTKLSNTTMELESYFNPLKTFRRHISNVRSWRGPLPNANPDENLMLPFVSDVEVGEFVLVRDSPTARVVYLARVSAVNDLLIDLSAWGSPHKSQATSKFRPVMIIDPSPIAPPPRKKKKGKKRLKSGDPTTQPPRGVACSPWTWQLPAGAVGDLIIARDLHVLPDGKLDPVARKTIRSLPSGCAMRVFLS